MFLSTARRAAIVLTTALVATPAEAQLRAVPDQPASGAAAAKGVDVWLLNDSDTAVPAEAPDTIVVTAADGIRIVLVPDQAPAETVAAHGFVRRRYLPGPIEAVAAAPETSPSPAAGETSVAGSTGSSAAFFDRFSPYEPIYSVAGLNDSGAKLQVSFAFQPITGSGLFSHFRFAYTQTMFWAIDRPSGPFRATNYSPEAFFEVPIDVTTRIAAGYRHDSNGEGDPGSIDANRIYARAAKTFDLGDRWHLELAPQAWFYVGRRTFARDLDRYWGYTQLKASLLEDDGFKLSGTLRGNPGTGRGAAEMFASYPLARIDRRIGFYLFGQLFTGYGEAIDDYRIEDTHARIGIALTR